MSFRCSLLVLFPGLPAAVVAQTPAPSVPASVAIAACVTASRASDSDSTIRVRHDALAALRVQRDREPDNAELLRQFARYLVDCELPATLVADRAQLTREAAEILARLLSMRPGDSAATRLREAAQRLTASEPGRASPVAAVAVRAVRSPSVESGVGARTISRLQTLLSAGAAADVMQAMRLHGGATVTGDGADLVTRGGDPAETATFLNGVRLVSTARFESLDGSLFSTLDPQVLRSTEYSPGGFSARFGNALSGVVLAETDGVPDGRSMRAGLSSVGVAATGRTMFGARAGGWISTRVSETLPLLVMHGRRNEFARSPESVDLTAGVSIAPSPFAELRLVAQAAHDRSGRYMERLGYRSVFSSGSDAHALALSGRRTFAGWPAVLNVHVGHSARLSDIRFGVLDRARTDAVTSGATSLSWVPGGWFTARIGVELARYVLGQRGVVPLSDDLEPGSPSRWLGSRAQSHNHLAGWFESDISRGGLVLTVGSRIDRLPGMIGTRVDPRVALRWGRGDGGPRLHLAAGQFSQSPLRQAPGLASGAGVSDVPTAARHLVLGVSGGHAMSWQLEGFAKRYGDYQGVGAHPLKHSSVVGYDALVQRKASDARRLDGWLLYSHARAVAHTVRGAGVPGNFDVPHALTVVGNLHPREGWMIGTTSRVASGRPWTTHGGTDTASEANDGRLPAFARVDLRLSRFLDVRGGLAVLYVEAINLLDRHNQAGRIHSATGGWQAMRQFFAERTIVVGVEWQR